MELRCFNVKCQNLENNEIIDVGVICSNEDAAKNNAVNSLFEGRNIKAKAISVERTNAI